MEIKEEEIAMEEEVANNSSRTHVNNLSRDIYFHSVVN